MGDGMYRKVIKLVASLLVLAKAQMAIAQEQIVLEPLANWELERRADECLLRRSFGSSEHSVTLELRRHDPWNGGFEVAVTSDDLSMQTTPFTAAWMPGGVEAQIDLPFVEIDAQGRRWSLFAHGLWDGAPVRLRGKELKRYVEENRTAVFQRQIETFVIDGLFEQTLILRTGPMQWAQPQLTECIVAVLADRGIAAEDMTSGRHRATLNNASRLAMQLLWFLPREITSRKKRILVSFFLFLDEKGEPVTCRLSMLPRFADLERRGCDLIMSQARFTFASGVAA